MNTCLVFVCEKEIDNFKIQGIKRKSKHDKELSKMEKVNLFLQDIYEVLHVTPEDFKTDAEELETFAYAQGYWETSEDKMVEIRIIQPMNCETAEEMATSRKIRVRAYYKEPVGLLEKLEHKGFVIEHHFVSN